MELQFHKTGIGCLKNIKWEVQNQEQTQEVRLGDGMPDIGRVLGAWGQVIMRSKQWQSDSLGISGGVMVWVLYAPEDGSPVRSVETWVPFQLSWDIPDTKTDGTMIATCLLRSADARMTAARKLMVRVNVGVLMQAYMPDYADVYHPEDLPEDVQVLKKTYPVCLPKDAGEKAFTLDEELELPAERPKSQSFLRYAFQPQILESRVMAGKLVFRGSCWVRALYTDEEGSLQTWDFDVPFSQFTELNGDFGEGARALLWPQATGMEMTPDEQGRIRMKASVTCQYVICEEESIEVVADAYSPLRELTAHCQALEIPAISQMHTAQLPLEHIFHADGARPIDGIIWPDQARVQLTPDGAHVQLPAMGQMLYYDPEDTLQTAVLRWEDEMDMEVAEGAQLYGVLSPGGKTESSLSGQDAALQTDVKLTCLHLTRDSAPMVTALELGQLREKDPARPSVILRRMGQGGLWQLAKKCGSSQQAIMQANGLTEEPACGKMLIIPVL